MTNMGHIQNYPIQQAKDVQNPVHEQFQNTEEIVNAV